MAKELPYFEFEPAEYLAGDISFCSLESQGLFVLICCYYWQRSCSLTKEQFLKRMNKPKEFEELIKEKIIKVDDRGFISINFLNDKFEKATEKSKINSINGAKGGRPKKQSKSENKPNAFNSLSETKGIREDNIIKEEIKENNIKQEILKSQIWIESICKNKRITYDVCLNYLNTFLNDAELKDELNDLKDSKKHFVNWLNIKLKNEPKQQMQETKEPQLRDFWDYQTYEKECIRLGFTPKAQ